MGSADDSDSDNLVTEHEIVTPYNAAQPTTKTFDKTEFLSDLIIEATQSSKFGTINRMPLYRVINHRNIQDPAVDQLADLIEENEQNHSEDFWSVQSGTNLGSQTFGIRGNL